MSLPSVIHIITERYGIAGDREVVCGFYDPQKAEDYRKERQDDIGLDEGSASLRQLSMRDANDQNTTSPGEVNLDRTVTIRELIEYAKFLKSEDGEVGDYDRALLELVTDAAHIAQNDRTLIARLIGVDDYIHKTSTS